MENKLFIYVYYVNLLLRTQPLWFANKTLTIVITLLCFDQQSQSLTVVYTHTSFHYNY